ncbi:MAG: site-2 protease family protein [Eubacteriales bacterium]|nr:site-2 protease family protein [Eubacteriales bacterium]
MNPQISVYYNSIPKVINYILLIPVALFALSIHEYAHGYTANKLGDPTAKLCGRLTVNPLAHLDIIGTVCMIFFHVGWARPVPIDVRYFRNPKRDMALTAIAGPAVNILLSFVCVPIFLLVARLTSAAVLAPFFAKFFAFFLYFILLMHILNLGLGIFNLIPIPPLDGSRALLSFMPTKWYFQIMRYERFIALLMIILLCFTPFSSIISYVIGKVSGLMFALFSFIL